jgi:hypothetical protein
MAVVGRPDYRWEKTKRGQEHIIVEVMSGQTNEDEENCHQEPAKK